MGIMTRGELKGQILRILMKTAKFRGPYTDDKINDAIQESLDYVSTKFFLAGEGWSNKMLHLDTVPGQISIDLSVSVSMIKDVRYLYATIYTPMVYDDAIGLPQYSSESGARQYSSTYRIVDNSLYFNPPLAVGGEKYLQIEYMAYSKKLLDDADFIESHFDNCMQQFIKYRSCTILAAGVEKYAYPWAGLEKSWYDEMVKIIEKRNLQTTTIREFGGC